MAYNHGREDRKWRIWKEAEEKLLRECGVDEATIEQIRIADRADFNSNRRFYRWTNEVKQEAERFLSSARTSILLCFSKCFLFISSLFISYLSEQNAPFSCLIDLKNIPVYYEYFHNTQGYFITVFYLSAKSNQCENHADFQQGNPQPNCSYISCVC